MCWWFIGGIVIASLAVAVWLLLVEREPRHPKAKTRPPGDIPEWPWPSAPDADDTSRPKITIKEYGRGRTKR